MMESDKKPRESLIPDIAALINSTGYPLELKVYDVLSKRGFECALGALVTDNVEGKEKSREIDIRATRLNDDPDRPFQTHIDLAIECKDTSDPFVCFGVPVTNKTRPEHLDRDFVYCQVATSRDQRIPNQFAAALLDDSAGLRRRKHELHFLAGARRNVRIVQVERAKHGNNEYWKLHTSEKLHSLLRALACVRREHSRNWFGDNGWFIERQAKKPVISVCFCALLTTGEVHEFSLESGVPSIVDHVSIFQRQKFGTEDVFYVVEVVRFDALESFLTTIERTCDAIFKTIWPWVKANGRQ